MKQYEAVGIPIDPNDKEKSDEQMTKLGDNGFQIVAAVPILSSGETTAALLFFQREKVGQTLP